MTLFYLFFNIMRYDIFRTEGGSCMNLSDIYIYKLDDMTNQMKQQTFLTWTGCMLVLYKLLNSTREVKTDTLFEKGRQSKCKIICTILLLSFCAFIREKKLKIHVYLDEWERKLCLKKIVDRRCNGQHFICRHHNFSKC